MKKVIAGLALLSTVSLSAFGAENDVLRFGTDPTYPPYEYKLADGTLAGLDIAVGKAICERASVKCEWVETGFDGLIPGLNAKKFDAILSSMAPNAQRQKVMDFTQSLYQDDTRLISAKAAPLGSNAEALSGKNIGVLQGSVQAKYALEKWRTQGVNVVEYPDQENIYADLANGRLNATLVVATAGQAGFLAKPAGKDFAFSGEVVKDPVLASTSAIGLRKGDEATRQKIDSAVSQLKQDGTISALEKQYLGAL
ncbi:transporter substrate-binding domain-containing protein [Enterobacter sp. CC120223-11]|uniref:transporter substrate-binding domain-containing protein n=1 Tax=Enterobacter sp. CC120223-11 TaxID=1378073 RepID=UPI000BD0E884|nr:transporter substrate-binding domain-containing protein [Enterobacter sp. CC120223-11]SNY64996.1 amino acid ABC transporter substrate-binding protein, PAAT family [Enterobacter sp. CC120223-11]